MKAVLYWCQHHDILSFVALKKLRLTDQWIFKFVEDFGLLVFEIEAEDAVFFHKDQGVVQTILIIFLKEKLHGNVLKYLHVFQHDFFILDEI